MKKKKVIMSRIVDLKHADRSFDLEFWHKVGAEGRFSAAWGNRIRSRYGDETIYILNIKDLIVAKKRAGRPQDKIDLERLLAVKKKDI